MQPHSLELLFSSLFQALKAAHYFWEPLIPERIQALRKQQETRSAYDSLVRFFGIGMSLESDQDYQELSKDLQGAGLEAAWVEPLIRLNPQISRLDDLFIPSMHWPAAKGSQGFVYLGRESFELARYLAERPFLYAHQDVLDLGSGSGVLSFAVARGSAPARRIHGLEISNPAVEWSRAAAAAQNITQVTFHSARIGSKEADERVTRPSTEGKWLLAVSNPPLAVPTPGDARPHRDGGKWGVELPLLFMEFAARHLARGGEFVLTAANPLIRGRPQFFDRIDPKRWEIVERSCLDDHFNASLHRKEGYAELGIQKIELWISRLRKLA